MMTEFSLNDAETLENIIKGRRDVRGNLFKKDSLAEEDVEKILDAALHAPSVGYSQPWEFILIRDKKIKEKVHNSFLEENQKGSSKFSGEKESLYQSLRLEGILETPINIAVFHKPSSEPTLGATTMEEMRVYSVVCAIQNMWLMARSLNIGMGWVSILNPEKVKEILGAPNDRTLVGYLCFGKVKEFFDEPELLRAGWSEKKEKENVIFEESYPAQRKGTING